MTTHLILNLYFSLLLLSYFPCSNADIPPCNAQDTTVLLRIRDHFGGPNGNFDDWSNNNDCCAAWSFVGCSSKPGCEYGRVTAVTTSTNLGLSGTIPSDFGDLHYLDFLSLAQNVNLAGPIPKSLSQLKKLYSLSGPIGGTSALSSLVQLDVSLNALSGNIPKLPKSLNRFPTGLNRFPSKSFEHNKCLCGSPLAPCK